MLGWKSGGTVNIRSKCFSKNGPIVLWQYFSLLPPHKNLNIIGNLEKFMSTSQKSLFQNRVSYYLVRKTSNNKTNLCFLFVIFRSSFFCSFICVRKSNHYNKWNINRDNMFSLVIIKRYWIEQYHYRNQCCSYTYKKTKWFPRQITIQKNATIICIWICFWKVSSFKTPL